MPRHRTEMTGLQKAAVLMISLGPEVASNIYKRLSSEEVEQLTLEIANLRKVDIDQREHVVREFRDIVQARDYLNMGGIDYAREVLEKALGASEAANILNRLTASLEVKPFHFAKKADPQQILSFIRDEHPQTMALVLSYLDASQAALILSALPHELQADVARRIALMNGTTPEVISEVEQIIEAKLTAMGGLDNMQNGGVDAVVKILNGVDRGTEKAILEQLELQDPDLVDEIKKRMFIFDDIILLDPRSIQRVIRDVDPNDLQLSLKVADEDVKEVIFSNMSKRMADTFREEMEFMGPVRLRDVEDAQQRVVGVIRRLEESGEIVVSRRGGDDVIV